MTLSIELDGKSILSEADFHRQIALKMEFPAYYGENLDALWDCIVDACIGPDEVNLVWKDSSLSREKMGSVFEKVVEIFDRLSEDRTNFHYELH